MFCYLILFLQHIFLLTFMHIFFLLSFCFSIHFYDLLIIFFPSPDFLLCLFFCSSNMIVFIEMRNMEKIYIVQLNVLIFFFLFSLFVHSLCLPCFYFGCSQSFIAAVIITFYFCFSCYCC
eukprot:UN04769